MPGVVVAEVELPVFPLPNDVRDVECGLLGTFLAFHGATPPIRSRSSRMTLRPSLPFTCLQPIGLGGTAHCLGLRMKRLLDLYCNSPPKPVKQASGHRNATGRAVRSHSLMTINDSVFKRNLAFTVRFADDNPLVKCLALTDRSSAGQFKCKLISVQNANPLAANSERWRVAGVG